MSSIKVYRLPEGTIDELHSHIPSLTSAMANCRILLSQMGSTIGSKQIDGIGVGVDAALAGTCTMMDPDAVARSKDSPDQTSHSLPDLPSLTNLVRQPWKSRSIMW
jgi:hypothetical protein